MCSKFAAYQRPPNASRATPPLPPARHDQNTHAASTPSPTNGGLLPHSPETNFVNRKGTARCAQAVVAALPTLVPCHPVSQSIAAASTDARLALAATRAVRSCRRIQFSGPPVAPPEKFPSD